MRDRVGQRLFVDPDSRAHRCSRKKHTGGGSCKFRLYSDFANFMAIILTIIDSGTSLREKISALASVV